MARNRQDGDESTLTREQYFPGYYPWVIEGHATRSAASHAAFFQPHLQPGMSLLNCGSGPGTISIDLSESVDPGLAVGIDIQARLVDRAINLARERGVSNIHFQVSDVYNLPFAEGCFDAASAQSLIQHLEDPVKAMKEMYRVLKPGGVVGISGIDLGGVLINPPDPILAQYFQLHERLHRHYGGNPRIGRQLLGLLQQAGFTGCEVLASFDCFGTPEALRNRVQRFRTRIRDSHIFRRAVALGWSDGPALAKMSAAWQQLEEHPDAFLAIARCQAVGRKEQTHFELNPALADL